MNRARNQPPEKRKARNGAQNTPPLSRTGAGKRKLSRLPRKAPTARVAGTASEIHKETTTPRAGDSPWQSSRVIMPPSSGQTGRRLNSAQNKHTDTSMKTARPSGVWGSKGSADQGERKASHSSAASSSSAPGPAA